jgi:alpha-maltose-1-phosphate synthase
MGFFEDERLSLYMNPVADGKITRWGTPPSLSGFTDRRQMPLRVPERQLRRPATLLELATSSIARTGRLAEGAQRLLRSRNRYFDQSVANALTKDHGLYVGTYTAAIRSMRRARALGIPSILNYPIAHHRAARTMLAEEARLNPEWAGTLQGHDLDPELELQMDAELDQADLIWVLSEFQAQSFVAQGISRDRLRVLGLGVDIELFRPRVRSVDRVFRVIFVGQITQRKGISYLIEGFRQAAIPNSELVLVGRLVGGPHNWRGTPGIKHIPAIRRSLLPGIYATADVFVAPTLVEGFMLTALEAMAMGLAVVASENTGVGEGKQGILVPVRSSEAVSSALRRLWSDPDLRYQLGTQARAFAEGHSWNAFRKRVPDALGTAQIREDRR